MGIVQTYLDTSVQTDQFTVYSVTNPSSEDYIYSHSTGATDKEGYPLLPEKYGIKSKETIQLPSVIAFPAVMGLARFIEYNKCEDKSKWKGSQKGLWVKIAEGCISANGTPSVAVQAISDDVKVNTANDVQVDTVASKNYYELSFKELQAEGKAKGINLFRKGKEALIKELTEI